MNMIKMRNKLQHMARNFARPAHVQRAFLSTVSKSTEDSVGESAKRKLPDDARTLQHFVGTQNKVKRNERRTPKIILPAFDDEHDSAAELSDLSGKSFFVETYGCQMNVSDSEIVASILTDAGMAAAQSTNDADLVLLNTCAIRENAEARVWDRLKQLKAARKPSKVSPAASNARQKLKPKIRAHAKVGLLGCMAERLKEKLLDTDQLVDFVVGPDAYRDLPRVISAVRPGRAAMNVQLSLEETYADIAPLRTDGNGLSAFVSIMRGCNNMCSFCVVPFTRGRERSRPVGSIVDEIRQLEAEGYKEVTLLGQNVNSYWDKTSTGSQYVTYPGFENTYKLREGEGARFVDLLEAVSSAAPGMRVRFTSPHPKDFPLPLLHLIAERHNLCKALHMPLQSGSSSVLKRMRRGYSREAFVELVTAARGLMPNLAISTDVITGFCGETEEEHAETLAVLEQVQFDQAFMFAYSERSHTHASHAMPDDVPEETKQRRLREVIATFRTGQQQRNEAEVGSEQRVLVEGFSKRSSDAKPQMFGRTDTNKPCVWAPGGGGGGGGVECERGDVVRVRVDQAYVATLQVTPLQVLQPAGGK